MKEIFEEFGTIGAPSIYEITKLIYETHDSTSNN